MSKRKAEDVDAVDKTAQEHQEKKAKTENKAVTYWVVKIERVDLDRDDYQVNTYVLGEGGEKKDAYGIGAATLFTSKSRALIAAILYHLEDVTPKQMRELNISDEWEKGSFQSLIDTLEKLNGFQDNSLNDSPSWCHLEVVECSTKQGS
jgi:hypothetical protein